MSTEKPQIIITNSNGQEQTIFDQRCTGRSSDGVTAIPMELY